MIEPRPFVVLSLPRSRSAWLSHFLSYRDWHCGHDQLRYMRSLDDVKSWLALPQTGSCETAAAPFWRLLEKYSPEARVLVVRRPVEEVLASFQRLRGTPVLPAAAQVLARLDRKLDQVEARLPNVLTVQYKDLVSESTCARIFEHCLPYRHDSGWWHQLSPVNIQINFPALARYVNGHAGPLLKLVAQARQTMLMDLAVRPLESREVVITEDSIDEWAESCQHLFRAHCLAIGERPDNWTHKNIELMYRLYAAGALQIMIGRCNGKAFGYLMTLISPSLEYSAGQCAQNAAFYASPEVPGLGLKLQRAALAALKERGIKESFMRAGVRGDGDRLDVLYRRLGGQDFGRVFRIGLEN